MTDKIIAPYAQAAAQIAKDGTLERAKGITSVQRTEPGRYTIKLEPHINALQSAPQATLNKAADWQSEIYVSVLDAFTIVVLTGVKGTATDEPFYFLLP
ncbi:hypothetical protein AB0O28_08190 [Microbispora sp. NPDC088329]|uniref:hypothetical protein n=1 Tax=Microbispora sp. NPDC088329 TaxID=3154869 RepID=UPI00341798EE